MTSKIKPIKEAIL